MLLQMAAANPGRSGILIALAGMLMFSLNDTMGKWLVATYPVGQVLLVRSVAAFSLPRFCNSEIT